jgi:hypothetical protein
MNPDLTAAALVQLVHRYYPAGLTNADARYDSSEQAQLLRELIRTGLENREHWKGFVQRLQQDFPDCSIWDATVPDHDPCTICRVSLPGFVTGNPRYDCVVCLLSHLAPVYALYAFHLEEKGPGKPRDVWLGFPPFPADFQAHEARLAKLIESTFGFTRLTNEILFTPVPDLVPRVGHLELGEARLIDVLFTSYRG